MNKTTNKNPENLSKENIQFYICNLNKCLFREQIYNTNMLDINENKKNIDLKKTCFLANSSLCKCNNLF